MRTRRFLPAAILAVSLFVSRAPAQLTVFDPANFGQVVQVVSANLRQIDQLASLMGVSTQQLGVLNGIVGGLGTVEQMAAFPRGVTQPQLTGLVQSNPSYTGLPMATVASFLNPTGVFDAFLGQSTAQWTQMVAQPLNYFGTTLNNRAIDQIGGNLGLTPPQTAYSQWVGAMSPQQTRMNAGSIALAGAHILLNAYFQNAAQRRAVTATFNTQIGADKTNANAATTANQALASQNNQTTTTNSLLLSISKDAQEHHDVQAAHAAAQTSLLSDKVNQDELNGAVAHAMRDDAGPD